MHYKIKKGMKFIQKTQNYTYNLIIENMNYKKKMIQKTIT